MITMALSKTVTPHDKDSNPWPRKWRKTLSGRIFTNNYFVDAGIKTTLLNAVKGIRSDRLPEVYMKS